jgi:hypothetical protein
LIPTGIGVGLEVFRTPIETHRASTKASTPPRPSALLQGLTAAVSFGLHCSASALDSPLSRNRLTTPTKPPFARLTGSGKPGRASTRHEDAHPTSYDSARLCQTPAGRNPPTTDAARTNRRVLDRSPHRPHPDPNREEPKLFEAQTPATSTIAPANRSYRDGDDLWRCACRVPLAGRRAVCRNRSDCPLTPPRRRSRGSLYSPSAPDA